MRTNLPGKIAIAILLLVALFIYKDYGITWDEPQQRVIGQTSYKYVFEGDSSLKTFHDRDYGVAFELPLIIIERSFNITDTRHIYLMRHFFTHLLFLTAAWFLYRLAFFLTRNQWLALLAVALLVLHPRIYAHSYFNSKDLPFLSVYIIGYYLAAKAFHYKKFAWFMALGMCCGILVNLRIMGVLLVLSVLVFIVFDIIHQLLQSQKIYRTLGATAVFLASAACMAILSWPYLWEDPVGNFMLAFENMSHFRWNSEVLFMGKAIKAAELPWTYFPVWFCITTPVMYILLGVTGTLLLVINFLRKPLEFLQNTVQRNYLLYLANFAGPILAVIILKSVLYDGWRQMFFVYPPFVLLALYVFHMLYNHFGKNIQWAAFTLFSLYVAYILVFMVNIHPNQQVYFNEVPPKEEEYLHNNFELDYWGATYKQALDHIAKNDTSKYIQVTFENAPGTFNLMLLDSVQRRRIVHNPTFQTADYYITNYRWHPKKYEFGDDKLFYEIKLHNSTVSSTWKLGNSKK